MSADLVTITIDGVEVSVPAGTLVIRAAEQIGKYIPRFCDHPLLDPLGACRQCLVEIEGQRKPLTACTTTATQGMIVRTQFSSDVAKDAQEGVLELLLINHPLDCPTCDKGGECPLQDQALAYGPGGSRYIDPKRRFVKPLPISPLIKLDRERCVLCARCTRFSDQIAGDPFIELFERGALEQVAVFEDQPYESIFSGNVVQICPVGALLSSTFRFSARPFDMTTTSSTCTRCASGCSISVQERRGGLTRILAREEPQVNDEWLCDKGRYAYAYMNQPERITEPMVRKNGELVAVSWAEAIDVVATKIGEARDAGRGAAVVAGQQLLDEDAYALARFARTVLATNDVDARRHAGSEDEDAVLSALSTERTATYQDIDGAKVVLVIGADPREESPIVFLRLRKNARKGLVVRELTARRGLSRVPGSLWTPVVPGREALVLRAIAAGLEAKGNSALDPFTRAANVGADPAALLADAGLDDESLGRLVDALDGARGAVVILAGERLASVPGALGLAWNLAIGLGGTFGWLPRKAGARGAAWAGLHPNLLPGGRRVDDAAARELVETIWGAPVPSGPTTGDEGGVLFLVGADPVTDAPALASAIDRAGSIVALDQFITASSAKADVLLPVTAHYERNGSITNWEGRTQQVRAAVPALGLSQNDHEILAQIASACGIAFPQTLRQLHEEMNSLDVELGPARPVALPDFDQAPADEMRAAVGPRLLDDGTMMRGADLLARTAEDARVEIHPEDAERLGIEDGATVDVSGVAGIARVSRNVAPGAVFVPAHVDGARGLSGAVAVRPA